MPYLSQELLLGPYFTRITTKMRNCGEDVTEIEVKPDGSWRVKAENDQKSLGQLGQWHLPDGTLFVPTEIESKPKPEALKQVKHEGGSEGHNTSLKLGLKRNRNGIWEVCKQENLSSLSSERFVSNGHDRNNYAFPISSSATVSGINQDVGGCFGHSTTNVADFGSLSSNMDPGYGFPNLTPPAAAAGGVADVIVLSDSDEETENRMSPEPAYNKNGTFSILPQTEDIVDGSSCLGSFNNNDDFGVQFWSLPSTTQVGPCFEFFRSDENVHHGLGGPTSMDGFTLTDEIGLNAVPLGPDSPLYQSNLDIDDGLVDNPLAFGHNDPSLQLFLPTRPPVAEEQVESTVSKGLNVDDWISLRVGGSGGNSGVSCEPAPMNGLNLIQQPPPRDGDMDTLAGSCRVRNSQPYVPSGPAAAASLLLGTKGRKSGKTRSRERSDNPFSFPRQKRSARPRLYPSIQTDSEQDR